MNETYSFEYVNENEFKELESSLKKYQFSAYKKLYYEFYPALKKGNFLGEIVDFDKGKGKGNSTTIYELKLPTDLTFSFIRGNIRLHYTVYERKKIVMFDKFTSYDILMEGSKHELKTYKGVLISGKNSDKDIFKIKLLLDIVEKNHIAQKKWSDNMASSRIKGITIEIDGDTTKLGKA